MTDQGSAAATERVWDQMLASPREALEDELRPTDLQTLLMAVARRRASAVTPARILRRWREDRFVQPAICDPRDVAAVEAALWNLLPTAFVGIDLSPVAPLGTSSVVATVDQNRVVSTVRGTEVVSDPTNVLAIEAAARRQKNREQSVDLAACHRVIRAQHFDHADASSHFRLFACVSSTRDTGSGNAEAAMLTMHLAFWIEALATSLPNTDIRIRVTPFGSSTFRERFDDAVLPALQPVPDRVAVEAEEQRRQGRGYYTTAALRISAGDGASDVELGDGGFVDWTSQYLGDAKERCLITCIAIERLAALLP
jgi:hypothetical protein